ncbi:MAG: hypothetical protein SGI77_05260 [Pirellulaceae bacterium]|nr:hypothetical protein [Pirellulaceae bacterium]
MIRIIFCIAIAALPIKAFAQNIPGIVTYSMVPMAIERDGGVLQAGKGAKIYSGDWIVTPSNGSSTLWLEGDASLMLSASSKVRLVQKENEWTIHVAAGEVRVTNSGNREIVVGNSQSAVHVRRAILRFSVDGQQNQARVEIGEAYVVSQQQESALPSGKDILVNSSTPSPSGSIPSTTASWKLQPSQVQLAAAVMQTPDLQTPGGSNSPVANPDSAPSNQSVTQPPTTGNAATNNNSSSASDALSEEERRRLRPTPSNQQAANNQPNNNNANNTQTDRGSTRSGLANQLFQGSGGTAGSSTLSIGSVSGSSATPSSGGLFADANQQTFEGKLQTAHSNNAANAPFAGSIHLVTGQVANRFDSVQLSASEIASVFPTNDPQYYSIGLGAAPTSQVLTDVGTATDPIPTTLNIAQFDAHLIRFDQYGIPVDAAVDNTAANANNVGITGFVGSVPSAPTVIGATPLSDNRDTLNAGLTFALGEFSVRQDGNTLSINVRRSDQDRLIVKDPDLNDANDEVTANQQIATYDDVADARFLPQAPSVKVPSANSYNTAPLRYSQLDRLRQAGFTTLTADRLYEYASRTGQTRFVVDGKIVDISGYKR